MVHKTALYGFFIFLLSLTFLSTGIAQPAHTDSVFLLVPAQVFDGEQLHKDWVVLVKGHRIEAAGGKQTIQVPANARSIVLDGCTLLPGLIEGHSHLFLHPYNETSWNNQVLRESRAERLARATVHARKTLMAGFTTVRDLGTEGAMYDDVGLKQAIEKNIIPGPRMLTATRAIVATGSYAPKELSDDLPVIRGAAEADGVDGLAKEVRTQIGMGADLIKIYADYSWGPGRTVQPTFTEDELKLVVSIASSSGREVVAHSSTKEGMRRSIMAGVSTIEHGDDGDADIFSLMKQKGIAYCPTLSATEAYEQYRGWHKGTDPLPAAVLKKKESFKAALDAGTIICMGGDVGVYAHGDNAREMEAMVEYGMKPIEVLRSATSVNAKVFGLGATLGKIQPGLFADIIAVEGDPVQQISAIRKIRLVMKNGVIYNDR
jgi:imidazolonepropionase-like amidohydrolase